MTATIPPPTQPIADNSGKVLEPWYRFLRTLSQILRPWLTLGSETSINQDALAHIFDFGSVTGTVEAHTSATGGDGPYFLTYHNSSSPAGDPNPDHIGGLMMYGKNSDGDDTQYGILLASINDALAGAETSSLEQYVQQGGTRIRVSALNAGQSVHGDDRAHIFNFDEFTGSFEIHSSDPGPSGPHIVLYHNSASPLANDFTGGLLFYGEDSGGNVTEYAGIRGQSVVVTGGSERGALTSYVTINGTPTAKLRVDADGIKFNSDTASDNALNDYEQGTFSPTLTTTGTDFTSVTYDSARSGRYTKIGDVVYIQITMLTDAVTVGSASGVVSIGNLPFTVGSTDCTMAISTSSAWAGEEPSAALAITGTNLIQLGYRTAADGEVADSEVADVGTGTNDNALRIGGFYYV